MAKLASPFPILIPRVSRGTRLLLRINVWRISRVCVALPLLRSCSVTIIHCITFPLDDNANRAVIHSPVMAALNGQLDVSVFFVLSGYVLTAKYFGTKDRTIILNMAAARYPRLAIPALVSLLIAYAVATLGWFSQYLAKMQILSSLGFGPDAWWEPVSSCEGSYLRRTVRHIHKRARKLLASIRRYGR